MTMSRFRRLISWGEHTKPDSCQYADYSPETLQECLEDIRRENLSWQKASEYYKISFRTIANKLKVSYHDDVMTQVYIPRYRLVDDPPEKPHYVYIIEVLHGGRHHTVERRYSAFHCLHRELRKSYSTPVFPPKRVRSCQTKVLERRRQSLEQYLQVMLRFGPSRDQVLAFLGISKPRPTEVSVEATSEVKSLDHQPIYKYNKDPYIDSERKSTLPDVVTQGVLMALYGKTQ